MQVTITAAGVELLSRAHADFEAEIGALLADLNSTQRARLSAIASLVVATDARRRGFDIFNVEPASGVS